MTVQITPWVEFMTPGVEGAFRRVGDTLELRCQKYGGGLFDWEEFLKQLGLRVDTGKTEKSWVFMIEGQVWEVDEEVRVPKFETIWEKMGFLLFFQDPYKIEMRRKRIDCFYDYRSPRDGNPRFVSSSLTLIVPVVELPKEEG